jgi:hypothetical protein
VVLARIHVGFQTCHAVCVVPVGLHHPRQAGGEVVPRILLLRIQQPLQLLFFFLVSVLTFSTSQ